MQGLIYEFSWFINLKIDNPWILKELSEKLYVIYFLMFYLYLLRNKWNSWIVGSYFVLTIYNLSIKNCFLLKLHIQSEYWPHLRLFTKTRNRYLLERRKEKKLSGDEFFKSTKEPSIGREKNFLFVLPGALPNAK